MSGLYMKTQLPKVKTATPMPSVKTPDIRESSLNDLLYIITLEGVYCQGILGIYDNLEDAIKNGKKSIKEEKDDYHQVHISYVKKNTLVDDYITIIEFDRNDEENKIYQRNLYNAGNGCQRFVQPSVTVLSLS